MTNSGDAAEQIVRMSLEGTEVALKLSGSAAKNIAAALYQDAIDVTIADNQLRIIALTGVKMDKFYEMRIFFAGDGSIYRMECAGIPDKTYAEEDRELWSVVEILTTSPEDAELLLQSIDLTILWRFHADRRR